MSNNISSDRLFEIQADIVKTPKDSIDSASNHKWHYSRKSHLSVS